VTQPGTAAALDDEALLRLTAAGDEGAFGTFVDRHQSGIWRRAMALTGQRADAEDLMQDTFVAAWRGAGSFRGGNARAWLLTITAHAWQRLGRRTAPLVGGDDAESVEELALRAGWGRDDGDERAATVQEAFARLAADDRRLLVLRDIEEMSGEDVAALLGLSLAAMKSRLHRARLRLAAAYEEVRHGSA
jgi:RNA polymerase sigma-70 factor, ECF subfamily